MPTYRKKIDQKNALFQRFFNVFFRFSNFFFERIFFGSKSGIKKKIKYTLLLDSKR